MQELVKEELERLLRSKVIEVSIPRTRRGKPFVHMGRDAPGDSR